MNKILSGMGLVSTLLISDAKERAEDNLEMVPGNMDQVSNTNMSCTLFQVKIR